jgi:hypothetical protein
MFAISTGLAVRMGVTAGSMAFACATGVLTICLRASLLSGSTKEKSAPRPAALGRVGRSGWAKPFALPPFCTTIKFPFAGSWRGVRGIRRGYAVEAARAAIEDGFGRLGFDEIIAFTVPANERS